MLFKDYSTEIKPILSGIDVSIELSNINSAIEQATEFVKEIVSETIYDIAETHYKSDDYKQTGFEILDGLVFAFQKAIANYAFYVHFPFLSVRISNDSITRRQADGEQTAYKYQMDDVRNALVIAAYQYIDLLIKYLDANKTEITEWETTDEYKTIRQTFFNSYKQYNRILEIGNNAFLFYQLAQIMNEIIVDELEPLYDFTTIRTEYETLSETDLTNRILGMVRRFLVYRSFATMLLRFDFNMIPKPYREQLDNEMTKSNRANAEIIAREKLSAIFNIKANSYLQDFESFIETQKRITDTSKTINYTENFYPDTITNQSDKFVTSI